MAATKTKSILQESSASSKTAESAVQAQPVSPNTQSYKIDRHSLPHWSGDGKRLEAFSDNKLIEIDLSNNLARETTFAVPEEDQLNGYGDDGERLYSWNDSYVFLPTGGALLPARVMELEGKETIVNALLFDRDGKLVKKFPKVSSAVVEKDKHPYEKSVSHDFSTVRWITEDVFAIDVRAKLYLYSVSKDELRLVEDCSKEVAAGFTTYCAGSYGTREMAVADGFYYYTICHELNDKQETMEKLRRVNWDNRPEELLGGEVYDRYEVDHNVLVASRYRYATCPMDGEGMSGEQVWTAILSPDSQPVLTAEPVTVFGDMALGAGGYITTELPHQHISNIGQPTTFTFTNVASGERITVDPVALEKTKAEFGAFGYTIYTVLPREGGLTFFYQTADTTPGDYDFQKIHRFVCSYNTASKEQRRFEGELLLTNKDTCLVNSDGRHFVEVGNFGMEQHSIRISETMPF